MRTTLKAVLAVMLLSAGLAVAAQAPWKNPRMAKELGLTPDQTQKLEDLQYQHQKQMIDVKRDLALKRLDLKREMQKDSPDRAVLDKLSDETSALRGRMQKLRMNHMLDAKKILTPEQVQKIKEHMADRRGRMREHGQGGFRRHDSRGGQGQGPGGLGRGPNAGPGGPGGGPQPNAEMESGQGPGPDGPPPADIAENFGPEPGFGEDFDGPESDAFDGPQF